jgi:hypothetical protein
MLIERMAWALLTAAILVLGVAWLLATVRRIHAARQDDLHYRLSIRFWAGLAALGGATAVMLLRPILDYAGVRTEAGLVTVGLIAILPAIVVLVGLRNAWALARAHHRRGRARAHGIEIEGRVVECLRAAFAQDLMALVVEVDLPVAGEGHELSYRARDPERTRRHRFVETCPADHWTRLRPGQDVRVLVDFADPRAFAVRLF